MKKTLTLPLLVVSILVFSGLGAAATITKPTLFSETWRLNDAEFEWVPVDASGLHTIDGHDITLHETNQLVTLEIHVSGWGPNKLAGLQATVDSAGYSNGVGGSLNPLGWPGTPEDGAFINTSHPDYIFAGMTSIPAMDRNTLDYIWGAILLMGDKDDDGETYYLGTLILEVPSDASDTYTIEFMDINKTFMVDNIAQKITPQTLTPASIKINEPPNKPTITGKTNGKVDTPYNYEFTSTDPNTDDISYYIKWGDGNTTSWTTYQTSGTSYSESHTWSTQGNYTIEAKTKDIYGIESDWATLEVSMPINQQSTKHSIYPLLYQILERLLNIR